MSIDLKQNAATGSCIYLKTSGTKEIIVIVPKTAELVWQNQLESLAPFVPGDNELIVISPHPDDETLGVGGLIASHCARGGRVTVVAVTDGEHAYDDIPNLAATRIREQEEAVAHLSDGKANIIRLGFIDSSVARQEAQLKDVLRRAVTSTSHLIAPWTGDFHPDHEACGRAAAAIAQETGARLTWYFFWTWHRGTPETIANLSLKTFKFDDDLRERKWRALLRHKSQLQHPSGEPILPANLLAPAARSFEVFAAT